MQSAYFLYFRSRHDNPQSVRRVDLIIKSIGFLVWDIVGWFGQPTILDFIVFVDWQKKPTHGHKDSPNRINTKFANEI